MNYISVFHDSFYVAGAQILYTHPLYGVAISLGSNDAFKNQNLLIKKQGETIQILKDRNQYLEECVSTLTKAYHIQEELCQTQEALLQQMMDAYLRSTEYPEYLDKENRWL